MTEQSSTAAWVVAIRLVDEFASMDRHQQEATPEHMEHVAPFLNVAEGADSEERDRFVGVLTARLTIQDWPTDEAALQTQALLYETARNLAKQLAVMSEPIEVVLLEDASRQPPTGHDQESISRLRRLGLILSEPSMRTLVDEFGTLDWSVPELAGARLLMRVEFALDADDTSAADDFVTRGQVLQGLPHLELEVVAAAVSRWLDLDPAVKDVEVILRRAALTAAVQPALRRWASRRTETERTNLALMLVNRGVEKPVSFAAVAADGINQVAVAARADRVIRKLDDVSKRKGVASMIASFRFTDDEARTRLVRLIGWLLHGNRKKGDQAAAMSVLDCLAPTPLADPSKLARSISRARNLGGSRKLKLTGTQGEKLAALGVKLKKDWFGKDIAKRLRDSIPSF